MNQNSSSIKKHHCSQQFICSFNNCKNEKRLLCQQCLDIHQHKQLDQSHIIEITKFWNFIFNKIEPITKLRKQLKYTIQQINHNNPLVIKNEVIEKLLNIENIEESELPLIIEYINAIKYYEDQELKKEIQREEQEQEKQEKELKKQQKSYDSYYYLSTDKYLYSSSITNSEQYLAYTKENKQILFLNIKLKKKEKIQYLKHKMQKLLFNNQSNLLFSRDYQGHLYSYIIKLNIKQLRKINTETRFFSDIKLIKDRVITSFQTDKIIIVYDIKYNTIINKIQDKNYTKQIDYDYENEIIVACQRDSIKFFNNKNEIIIDQQFCDQQLQIQLIHKCTRLITRSSNQINLWFIMYERKCLVQLNEFYNDDNNIYNCLSVNEGKNTLLITKDKLLIIDYDFNPIYFINHNITYLRSIQQIQLSHTVNYIFIMCKSNIQLDQKIGYIQLFKKN
ncbi:hypothetical protein pb186bvf_017968 [Paramecium bursaria]